jgi:hypothetical protein
MTALSHGSMRLFLLLAVATLIAGCGKSRTVKVIGKVSRSGKPIELSKTGSIQVTLVPDVPEGTEFTTRPARAKADGSFEVADVPPGTYRIAVEVHDPTPRKDVLKGAFSVRKTKIRREIDGKKPLEIDLDKPGE